MRMKNVLIIVRVIKSLRQGDFSRVITYYNEDEERKILDLLKLVLFM